jgi:DNA-binding NarL/FixJ family response regulator
MKIRILIADDHKMIREAWKNFLDNDGRFDVIAVTGNSEEAINLARIHKPDIILMDINIEPFSGLEATLKIKAVQPRARIIGVSMYSQSAYAKKMMQNGAMGYVTKNSPKEEMVIAITQVHAGHKYICNEIKNIISDNLFENVKTEPDISKLTKRELEITHLIKQGKTSKEIGELFGIAVKTIEVHRHNILKKMNLTNSSALVNLLNATERFL